MGLPRQGVLEVGLEWNTGRLAERRDQLRHRVRVEHGLSQHGAMLEGFIAFVEPVTRRLYGGRNVSGAAMASETTSCATIASMASDDYLSFWTPPPGFAIENPERCQAVLFAREPDVHPQLRGRVLKEVLWFATEVPRKYSTRYRSVAAWELQRKGKRVGECGGLVAHEHAWTRATCRIRLLSAPDATAIEAIMSALQGCVVTKAEHQRPSRSTLPIRAGLDTFPPVCRSSTRRLVTRLIFQFWKLVPIDGRPMALSRAGIREPGVEHLLGTLFTRCSCVLALACARCRFAPWERDSCKYRTDRSSSAPLGLTSAYRL